MLSLIIALPIGLFLAWVASRRKLLMISLIIFFQLVISGYTQFALLHPNVELARLASISVFPYDVLSMVLFVAILLRLSNLNQSIAASRSYKVLSVFIIMFVVELFFYFSQRGTTEIAGSRYWLHALLLSLYLFSFSYTSKDLRVIYRSSVYALSVLYLLIVFNLFDVLPAAQKYTETRIISAAMASIIGAHFLISMVLYFDKRIHFRGTLFSLLSLLMLIIMQHRSVWLGTASGLMVVFLYYRRNLQKAISFALVTVIVMLFVIYFAQDLVTKYESLLDQSLITSRSQYETSTAKYRIDRWLAYFTEKEMTPMSFLVGRGLSWDRSIFLWNQSVATIMHNYYLELFFDYGIAGFLLFVLWNVFAFREVYILYKRDRYMRKAYYVIFLSLMTFFLVYSLAYSLSWSYYSYLAIFLSINISLRRQDNKTFLEMHKQTMKSNDLPDDRLEQTDSDQFLQPKPQMNSLLDHTT